MGKRIFGNDQTSRNREDPLTITFAKASRGFRQSGFLFSRESTQGYRRPGVGKRDDGRRLCPEASLLRVVALMDGLSAGSG